MTPIGRITAAIALAAALPAAHHAADRRGETRVYTLNPSTNGNPEGIAYDDSTGAFYVGATGGLEGNPGGGTIYRGTVDNPAMTEFIRGAGGEAAGMKVARGKLYVAGGFSGRVLVYDLATRLLVASFGNFGAGMLNDLVVTQQARSTSPTRSFPGCGTSPRRRSRWAGACRKGFRWTRKSSTTSARSRSTSTASSRFAVAGR